VSSDGKELEPRRPQQFAGLAVPMPTAATYDVVTEGRTGWRFLFTKRWIAFILGVIVYAAGCVGGVLWQWQLGAQIAEFNATVSENFDAPAIPLGRALPTLDSYRPAGQWQPVTASGTYDTAKQVVVRNRTCGSDTGFEVITPLRLTDERYFLIDRGCVEASGANPNQPVAIAPPPRGAVVVTARVVAGEGSKGDVPAGASESSGASESPGDIVEVDSIDPRQIARFLDAPTYSGAYGLLAMQKPAAAHPLHAVLTARPTVDGSAQEGTIFATTLYALVGLGIFGYALREKFRFVNRFDPRLWAREWRRIQRLARKPYTDAEIEDLLLDGKTFSAIRALETSVTAEQEITSHSSR
jgi:hypothetical protein